MRLSVRGATLNLHMDHLLQNVMLSQYVDFKVLESFCACCNELVRFLDSSGEMSEKTAVLSDG
jgi:hypothetical protein